MKKIARFLGITVQILVLSLLLFVAITKLIASDNQVRIFVYQTF